MYIIIISKQDPVSINIQRRLLEQYDWTMKEELSYDGNPVYFFGNQAVMITINEYHLFVDNIDTKVIDKFSNQGTEISIEAMIFATKHRSASGMRTLTVHPIGNYLKKAEYGGNPEELVPAAPYLMTTAYRHLYKNAIAEFGDESKYAVTFEATHHGPYLDTPSFFIEIGSDESAWQDEIAAKIIAKTIIEVLDPEIIIHCKEFPIAIGIGGGHYAPRHSDVARRKKISFGHIIPNYALEELDEKMLLVALERTIGAKYVYFHRKSLKKDRYRTLKSWFEDKDFKVVRFDDLEDLD